MSKHATRKTGIDGRRETLRRRQIRAMKYGK